MLQLKEHPKFKRKLDDLYVEHTLSLTEALCGFQFALTHLDGRQLLIKSNPGEVIKPGMGFHIYQLWGNLMSVQQPSFNGILYLNWDLSHDGPWELKYLILLPST